MTAGEAADRWLDLRDAFAHVPGLEIWVPEPGADHAVVRLGRAVLLLAAPAFLARPAAERAELRGTPPAPVILVGEPPAELTIADLRSVGVEQHWPVPGAVSARHLELALARAPTGEPERLSFEIRHVLDIAASLNAERDPDRLLARILESMRQLTGADAGSLYVVEDQGGGRRALRFRVAQNDTLGIDDLPSGLLPIDATSIVGYVVETRRPLNLADVDRLPPGLPVVFNKSYDLRAGYRTMSMLTVPLQAADGEILGAVQLINRKRDAHARLGDLAAVPTHVLPFSERDEQLAGSLAGAASIALVNARLTAEIRRLFDGFVRAAVFAIDSRDPCTSGHSLRVSRLSVALAGAAGRDARFEGALPLSEPRIRRLEYAALLHDFGKIGVSEDVPAEGEAALPLGDVAARVPVRRRGPVARGRLAPTGRPR